jgi:hypothetical protein
MIRIGQVAEEARRTLCFAALIVAWSAGCQKPTGASKGIAVPGGTIGGPTPAPSIHWAVSPSQVEVRDLPQAFGDHLTKGGFDIPRGKDVFRVTVTDGDGTPIMGSYGMLMAMTGTRALRFIPRFPFEPGVKYRAVFDSSKLTGAEAIRLESEFTPQRLPSDSSAEVTQVYPSSNRLPENLLRFYVHFATPMRRGEALDHIRLLNENGEAIVTPFLAVSEELWDPTGQRLTLFIDPGRIKRGLKPREDLGPVLEAGKTYTLLINAKWRDAHGQSLAKEHRKLFQVGSPTEKGIDPEQWQIEPPQSATKSALKVQFPQPLDYAILHRAITVVDSKGQPVAGQISVGEGEQRWLFVPQSDWTAGRYAIRIERFLEDVAGNRVGRPFEVDEDTRPVNADGPPVERSFEVR